MAIPIRQLESEVSGIRIDRISDRYIEAISERISKAHRNDHFICLLLESGKAEILVDFKTTIIIENKLLFLYPEQVKSVVSFSKSKGWVLFFKRSSVNEISNFVFEDLKFLRSDLDLSKSKKEWFSKAFLLLELSLKNFELNGFQLNIIESVLSSIIYSITSLNQSQIKLENQTYSSRRIEIANSFRKLLLHNFVQTKSPSEYADMMNISIGYLNDTVKHVTGLNVSKSIQAITISEAQRLLYHSSLRIGEIAEKVGYDDPRYFSRVFTKIVQQTPSEFRKHNSH